MDELIAKIESKHKPDTECAINNVLFDLNNNINLSISKEQDLAFCIFVILMHASSLGKIFETVDNLKKIVEEYDNDLQKVN